VWRSPLDRGACPGFVGVCKALEDRSAADDLESVPHQFQSRGGGRTDGQKRANGLFELRRTDDPSGFVAEREIVAKKLLGRRAGGRGGVR
jgi:hypothetical protein